MLPCTKKQRMSPGHGGFTLLEVMMAMAIFTIGILGVVGMQHLVVFGNANGNVVTQQLMLAQRVMEQMKNTDNPAALAPVALNGVDMDGNNGGPYTVASRVINPIGGDESRYIEVTVTKAGMQGHPVTIRAMTHGDGI